MSADHSSIFVNHEHDTLLHEHLLQQSEIGRFCDVTLHVGSEEYKAHRNILAACSPYFESIFSTELKASQQKKSRMKLCMVSTDPAVFRAVLEYIYSGRITVTAMNVADILRLANQLLLDPLKKYCHFYIESQVISGNERFENASQSLCTDALNVRLSVTSGAAEIKTEMTEESLGQIAIDTFPFKEQKRCGRYKRRFNIILDDSDESLLDEKSVITTSCKHIKVEDSRQDLLDRAGDDCQLLQKKTKYKSTGSKHRKVMGKRQSKKKCIERNNVKRRSRSSKNVKKICCENNFVETFLAEEHQDKSQPSSDKYSSFSNVDNPEDESTNIKVRHVLRPTKRRAFVKRKAAARKQSYAVENKRTFKWLPCHLCDFKCKWSPHLYKHYKVSHYPKEPYECDVCGVHAESVEQLVLHRLKVHVASDRTFECSTCSMTFRRMFLLKTHVRSCHAGAKNEEGAGESDKTSSESKKKLRWLSCHLCNYRCKWKAHLSKHYASTHFLSPPYLCDTCGLVLESVQLFVSHRLNKHDMTETRIECLVCARTFSRMRQLEEHMVMHTGARPFTCSVCGNSFMTKSTLEHHSRTHTDYKGYLCHLCGYSTKHHNLLAEHRRIHTGDLFYCDVPNCGYSSTRRPQLLRHMQSHVDSNLRIRPFVCSVCARAFAFRNQLSRHEKIHLPERPYKCEQCSFGCNRREHLKLHMAKCPGTNADIKINSSQQPDMRS